MYAAPAVKGLALNCFCINHGDYSAGIDFKRQNQTSTDVSF